MKAHNNMKPLIMNLLGFLIVIFLSESCGGQATETENNDGRTNIYNDATLRQIYDFRCEGNTAELIKFFSNSMPQYRKAAVLAVGTMKDSMATVAAASLLSDSDPLVRQAAVFSIGQIGHIAGQKYLTDYIDKEQNNTVRGEILVALGKCGDEKSLKTIGSGKIPHSETDLISGQIKGLCHLAKRGLYSINTTEKAINILCDTTLHEKIRAVASEYFAICNSEFSLYTDEFIKTYNNTTLNCIKENITLALGKCHNARSLEFLKEKIQDEKTDYRIVLNAINALENYPYQDCKDLILEKLKFFDEKISSYAAKYLFNKGIKADSSLYLELSREVPGWQTRTYLLGAALKYSNNKKSISASIKSGFEVAQNIYEKASLLRCLESDVSSYGFVENQTFYAENEMLRTEGLKTLIAMYDSPEFEKYSKRQMTLKGENLNEDFALIFKKAIQNGNTQMVALAAQAIASHSEISEYYMNTFFLNQAVSNCILPRDADTYTVLVDAVKKVNGQTIKPIQASAIDSPDWDYIRSINPGEKIIISTQKGEITLKTDINNAPVAVANFLRLVDEKYFDNSCFTNISTTFLENRGSITGYDENESVMLPTELTERVFDEGTVALITTALNNSVATQWFIMLTSKTVLDGTSSVIATVTDGMDCVHALNTGDNIISIRRLKE